MLHPTVCRGCLSDEVATQVCELLIAPTETTSIKVVLQLAQTLCDTESAVLYLVKHDDSGNQCGLVNAVIPDKPLSIVGLVGAVVSSMKPVLIQHAAYEDPRCVNPVLRVPVFCLRLLLFLALSLIPFFSCWFSLFPFSSFSFFSSIFLFWFSQRCSVLGITDTLTRITLA